MGEKSQCGCRIHEQFDANHFDFHSQPHKTEVLTVAVNNRVTWTEMMAWQNFRNKNLLREAVFKMTICCLYFKEYSALDLINEAKKKEKQMCFPFQTNF